MDDENELKILGKKTKKEPKMNQLGLYNMPAKSNYRQHAHINPLSELTMNHPLSPACMNWEIMYPIIKSKDENELEKNNSILEINTNDYPSNFKNENFKPCSTFKMELGDKFVNICDVGCGYGGLLENMSKFLKEKDLALGLEIREKVTNFVGERIRALRLNSKSKEYNNISVLRANSMKMQLNIFYKAQLDKIFFCFADPHFKKANHSKRIINKYLLNEYSYMLKVHGRLYIITDVKDLYDWEQCVLRQNACFKELSREEIEKDPFTEYMKNTNEAKKVIKIQGAMYYSIYERVEPEIKTLEDVYNRLEYTKDNKD